MFLKLFFIFFLNFTFLFNLNAHHPGNKIEAEIPYPKINIEVSIDKLEGYNLFFDLQNFKLSPEDIDCLLYTSPSPRDQRGSRMPSSA